MAGQVERFIRIENSEIIHAGGYRDTEKWQTISNGDRIRVLEYSTLLRQHEESGVDEKRHVFHIRYLGGIRKGSRVTYLGRQFTVREVSESGRLTGLELNCIAI